MQHRLEHHLGRILGVFCRQHVGIQNAVKLIRGKQGSQVTLGLLRNGKELNVTLTRARIEINALDRDKKTIANAIKFKEKYTMIISVPEFWVPLRENLI